MPDALDELARRHGVHLGAAVSRKVADADEAARLMRRLRAAPPQHLAGYSCRTTDLLKDRGKHRADALIFSGGDADTWARVVVRPSGTEPKLKCYIEVGCPVRDDLGEARKQAAALRDQLVALVHRW